MTLLIARDTDRASLGKCLASCPLVVTASPLDHSSRNMAMHHLDRALLTTLPYLSCRRLALCLCRTVLSMGWTLDPVHQQNPLQVSNPAQVNLVVHQWMLMVQEPMPHRLAQDQADWISTQALVGNLWTRMAQGLKARHLDNKVACVLGHNLALGRGQAARIPILAAHLWTLMVRDSKARPLAPDRGLLACYQAVGDRLWTAMGLETGDLRWASPAHQLMRPNNISRLPTIEDHH